MAIPTPSKENLIGIVVSVNYADKLKPTINHNMRFLKKLYVVTDPMDFETFDAVKEYPNIELVISSVAKQKEAKFNKSGLLRAAQQIAHTHHRDDWMVIFDADTLFPENLWTLLKQEKKNKNTVFLLKRAIYYTKESFEADKPDKKTNGAGFFQLYFDKTKMYNPWSKDAGICDIVFQHRFPIQKELDGWCRHLGQNGLDWEERISPQWA